MRTALIIAALALPIPVAAQQMDHSAHGMEAPAQDAQIEDPHAGHDMPDPHEGHDMGDMSESSDAAVDPHAGHDMDTMQGQDTTEPDSHAGHDMGGMQDQGSDDADPHAGHDMGGMDTMSLPQSGPPPEAFSGPEHAADTIFSDSEMAASREQLRREQGGAINSLISIDRLELQSGGGADAYVWEANAWVGGDLNKLWIKTEGEGEFEGSLDDAEVQALWSRAIGPWFDFQTGVRYDYRPSEPDTSHLVLGVQGLAPYLFEVDVAGFVSDEGDFTARAEAEYDQRITQRLILQPRVELNMSAQDIPELDIGSGLTSLDAGLRLRYEFVPEFAPYIGVEYQTDLGETRNITQTEGGDPDRTVFLAGVKFWF